MLWTSGTKRRTEKQALILISSPVAVARKLILRATNVHCHSRTNGQPAFTMSSEEQAVITAAVTRFAIATPCKPAAQTLLLNGAMPRMMAPLMTTALGQIKRCGGRMSSVGNGRRAAADALATVPSLRYPHCIHGFSQMHRTE